MKKAIIITIALTAFLLSSCDKLEAPRYVDPEFDKIEQYLDKSQANKFKESFICRLWVMDEVTRETYHDGALTETEDLSKMYSGWTLYFSKDHSTSNRGTWRYSYNHLMWGGPGSYYVYEVALCTMDSLWLKGVEPIYGTTIDALKADNISYLIYKYRAKN